MTLNRTWLPWPGLSTYSISQVFIRQLSSLVGSTVSQDLTGFNASPNQCIPGPHHELETHLHN